MERSLTFDYEKLSLVNAEQLAAHGGLEVSNDAHIESDLPGGQIARKLREE
jgi:hypothetical protein